MEIRKYDLSYIFSNNTNKKDPTLSRLNWCLKAMCKDKTKEKICGVKVEENGFIVATDGYRIHVIKNFDCCGLILPGAYDIVQNGSTIILFASPERTLLWPDWTKLQQQKGEPLVVEVCDIDTFFREVFHTNCYNYKYVLELWPDDSLPVKISFYTPTSPIVIESKNCIAYLMPRKI